MISLSDLRTIGRDYPGLTDLMLTQIEVAETLQAVHEIECGCPQPGALFTGCTWQGARADLLNRFLFDEELVG